jgi:hypothetical protein
MHMVFASLAAAIQPLDLIGPMYCGTVLLHRGNNIRALRNAIHSLVKDRLDISFEAVEHDDRNAQVIELIDAADRCTAKQLGRFLWVVQPSLRKRSFPISHGMQRHSS